MTVCVIQQKNVTVVAISSKIDGVYYDGSAELAKDKELFGKPAGELRDGVYSDEGVWLRDGTWRQGDFTRRG